MITSLSSFAQTSYSYYFNNNLHGTNGAPDLIPQCAATPTFSNDDFSSIGAGVRPVFNIATDCGLLFADSANFLQSGSYTIVLFMMMENVNGYRKLIDFKNLALDNGLYSLGGELGFYGSPALFSNNIYTDSTYFTAIISRDNTTKNVNMYANGQLVGSFRDTTNIAVYDSSRFLYFATDDSSTTTEALKGKLAMLRIFNYALDSAAAVAQTMTGTLLSVSETAAESTQTTIYPNPTTGILHIAYTAHSAASIDIYTIDGRLIQQDQLSDSGNISISPLPAGLYTMLISTQNSISYHKIIKQ